jgi:hypothetical protein
MSEIAVFFKGRSADCSKPRKCECFMQKQHCQQLQHIMLISSLESAAPRQVSVVFWFSIPTFEIKHASLWNLSSAQIVAPGVIVTSPPRVLARLQRLLYKSSFVRDRCGGRGRQMPTEHG